MLYDNVDPNSIKRALLYVMGGENVPIGKLNFIVSTIQEIFTEEKTPEVILAMSDSKRITVHLMATVQEKRDLISTILFQRLSHNKMYWIGKS
jgi:hypothetical protein